MKRRVIKKRNSRMIRAAVRRYVRSMGSHLRWTLMAAWPNSSFRLYPEPRILGPFGPYRINLDVEVYI